MFSAEQVQMEVVSDFDGYFESLLKQWLKKKTTPYKYRKIVITVGPFRPDAVTLYVNDTKDVVNVDFYSPLRNGFGSIAEHEINQIVNNLL